MGEEIPASGRIEFFPVRRLSLREVAAPVPSSAECEARDLLWEKAIQSNPELFDGPVTLTIGTSLAADGHLVISWARSSYRNVLLRRVPGATSWRPALFASVIQPDTDGRVVVGQMAAWTANPGRWQLPGGSVDPPAPGEPLDVEAVRRHAALEAREEIGRVGRAEDLSFWSVLRGGEGNVGVLFRARPESAQVVRQWFQELHTADAAEGRASEFDEIAFVGGEDDDVDAVAPAVDYLSLLIRRFHETAPGAYAEVAETAD